MTVHSIFAGLDRLQLQGAAAREAARAGFFQWVLSLEEGASSRDAARVALRRVAGAEPASPAARAFLGYLADAARFGTMAQVHRRGGRRRLQ